MSTHRGLIRATVVLTLIGILTIPACGVTGPEDFLFDSQSSAKPFDEFPANSAARRSNAVTTSLLVQVTSGSWFAEGWVSATFTATPLPDGNWSVNADFRARAFRMCVPPPRCSDVCGLWCNDVRGHASADFMAAPGLQTQIAAPGMHWIHPISGEQIDITLHCALTVDANGVVSVQTVAP